MLRRPPGSTLFPTRRSSDLTLRVANSLREDASIHWHGILLPANMDGVPGLSFHGIRPDETYTYRFNVRQAGTRSEEHTSELQSLAYLVCRLLLEKKKNK